MLIQGVQKFGRTVDGERRCLDGVRRRSEVAIQGVPKIGGTVDGDRRCLDGDKRSPEMPIQGAQKIRGTLDGDWRCLDGVRRCSEMLIQDVQQIGGTNAKICKNSQKCAKTAEDKPGRICYESGLGSGPRLTLTPWRQRHPQIKEPPARPREPRLGDAGPARS